MKLVLILSLVLVGVLEIPFFNGLEIEQTITKGEVKGEEVISQKSFEPAVQSSAPSLLPPSPRLSLASIIITPQSEIIHKKVSLDVQSVIKEIILLDKEKELKDEQLEIELPQLDQNVSWYLEVEFELISAEDSLGFDTPGFTIHVDDYLAYQRSVFEDGPEIINFNLAAFSNTPQTLSIWSGNNGDELEETYSIIKKIKLIPKKHHDFIETAATNDLVITVDSKDYLTLEWEAPETNDLNLEKPLLYEIRYSQKLISLENWSQAQKIEILLPKDFSPQNSNSKEIILIDSLSINSGYLAIRSIDSAGTLSPLGENALFRVKD